MMKRRDFLKASSMTSSALFVPEFLKKLNVSLDGGSTRKLIIIQLSGGNDGLNTFVPFHDDIYYRARPFLAVPAYDVLQLTEEQGLHPALSALRPLFDDGGISIINSVGYPNPDRSHFRSMDIWHSASESDTYIQSGWLGRYLDHACSGMEPHHAIEIGKSPSLAVKGSHRKGFALEDPAMLRKTAGNPFLRSIDKLELTPEDETTAYLYKTLRETHQSADYLYAQTRTFRSSATYPFGPFGKQLKMVADLLLADTETSIYYLSLSGFDTHVNQKGTHKRLLKQLGDGLQALVSDLKSNNLMRDTLIFCFSEFGRRVAQNGSNGTDHGAGNNAFLISGDLKNPGFYNAPPDLSELDNGDVAHQVDFRSIYQDILRGWLDYDSERILQKQFPVLGIV